MASSKRKTATPKTAEGEQPLPLFYKTPCVLDATRHATATVLSAPNYRFAAAANSVPLNAVEFSEAGHHYPIVFTPGAKAMPLAVLGLEQSNYFVETSGQWDAHSYIPAYIRQYPFIFLERPEQDKFYLCIDESAASFQADGAAGGGGLYNPDGSPSLLSQHALEFCKAYYQHHAVTRQMCEDLQQHQLLMPVQSEATLNNGRTLNLSGFQMLNESAVQALSDDVYLDLRRKGWLPFIYLALASTTNWKRLMDRANALQAAQAH